MNVETARAFFLWCSVLNYGLLILWAVLMILPHGWVYRVHGRLLGVTPGQVDAVQYGGLLAYKVAIFLFNIVPYVALRLAA